MKIGDQVKVTKDCGRKGEVGELVGKEKVGLTVVTPTGYLWRVHFPDGSGDGLFNYDELRVV